MDLHSVHLLESVALHWPKLRPVDDVQRRAGLTPTEGERQALHLAFIASYLMLLFSFHTGPSSDALIISLALPAKFTLPVRVMLGLFFLGAGGWGSPHLLAVLPGKRLSPASPWPPRNSSGSFFPPWSNSKRQGSSANALFQRHSGCSSFRAVSLDHQLLSAQGSPCCWPGLRSLSRYLLTLVAGGIALFIPGPWLASRLFHADFAASFLTFTALVNIHHFILDGKIWKLRDSRIGVLLLNKGSESTAQDAQPSRVAALFRWVAGTTVPARLLRVTLILLLLLWGGMDQLHFYWANASASLNSLQRAARMNPNDSALQSHLARMADLTGHRDLALSALQRAAEVSPGNIGVQEEYARALILAGRNADAYDFYRKLLLRSPQNANALLNYGLLAQKLGHPEEAIDSWQRAVAADPMQANAQLYLAQALEQSGELQAAARDYRAYLEIVAKHPSSHVGEGHGHLCSREGC